MRDESKVHFSQVQLWKRCPRAYGFKHVDGIEFLKVYEFNDPLVLGGTMHLALEKGYEAAEKFYMSHFMVMNNNHVHELIKIEFWTKRLESFFWGYKTLHKEFEINTDDYQGTIDRITENEFTKQVDIWDYKYAFNDNYDGTQLMVYSMFLEYGYDMKVSDMYYLIIPKCNIKQKQDESLYQFRARLMKTLDGLDWEVKHIPMDVMKFQKFNSRVQTMLNTDIYPKTLLLDKTCKWCEYKKICNGEDDYMALPVNKRVNRFKGKMDKWITGQSYSGKSMFLDKFENTLFLNTDGNIDIITSPVIEIKDKVWKEGNILKKRFAWEQFLDVVTELETIPNHGYEHIVLDLIEDLYEHCRLYKYDKLGIEHESDSGFGKGWDIIRTEFLSTIKRLKNLGVEMNYCSKTIEGSIKLRNGSEITTIKPNLPDKVANVLAGTVAATFLIETEKDKRYLTCAKDDNKFRGTRYDIPGKIALNKDAFEKAIKGMKVIVPDADADELKNLSTLSADVDKPAEPKSGRSRRGGNKPETPKNEIVYNGLICPKCGKHQYNSPSGATCEDGHGGLKGISQKEYDESQKPAEKPPVNESNKRSSRRGRGQEAVAEHDTYWWHDESGCYWTHKKGDVVRTDIDAQCSIEVDKAEYDAQTRVSEPVDEPAPTRRRRRAK